MKRLFKKKKNRIKVHIFMGKLRVIYRILPQEDYLWRTNFASQSKIDTKKKKKRDRKIGKIGPEITQ